MKVSEFIAQLQKAPQDADLHFVMNDGCCADTFTLDDPEIEYWSPGGDPLGKQWNYCTIHFPALDFLNSCIKSASAQRRSHECEKDKK